MFVLLRNLETSERFYVYTKNYSIEFERLLIEIYYRDLVEELIDYSCEVAQEELDTYVIEDWLSKIKTENISKKSVEALEKIKKLV